jgi:hypothetical protein
LVPATDPLDATIARTHVYADAVPRIGFCAPDTGWLGAGGAGEARAAFQVRAWRLRPASVAAGPQSAAEITPALVSGGTPADRGALYGPPISPNVRRVDLSANAAWPVGTYVFQVAHTGAEPAGRSAAWFAIELRGPWIRPEGGATPSPGVPPTAPATPPTAAP